MILKIFKKLGSILEKAHYHEYPVTDENEEIIGHEVVTTRGNRVMFIPVSNENSSDDSKLDIGVEKPHSEKE